MKNSVLVGLSVLGGVGAVGSAIAIPLVVANNNTSNQGHVQEPTTQSWEDFMNQAQKQNDLRDTQKVDEFFKNFDKSNINVDLNELANSQIPEYIDGETGKNLVTNWKVNDNDKNSLDVTITYKVGNVTKTHDYTINNFFEIKDVTSDMERIDNMLNDQTFISENIKTGKILKQTFRINTNTIIDNTNAQQYINQWFENIRIDENVLTLPPTLKIQYKYLDGITELNDGWSDDLQFNMFDLTNQRATGPLLWRVVPKDTRYINNYKALNTFIPGTPIQSGEHRDGMLNGMVGDKINPLIVKVKQINAKAFENITIPEHYTVWADTIDPEAFTGSKIDDKYTFIIVDNTNRKWIQADSTTQGAEIGLKSLIGKPIQK